MTEKELRKLNRYQLLELLVVQTERADKLQKKVGELERQLGEWDLQFARLGSIAEASLQLNGVFAAAQAAADQYLEAAKKQADELLEYAHQQAAAILERAAARALAEGLAADPEAGTGAQDEA